MRVLRTYSALLIYTPIRQQVQNVYMAISTSLYMNDTRNIFTQRKKKERGNRQYKCLIHITKICPPASRPETLTLASGDNNLN